MNFCVATLILKAEENGQYFRHIILYYFKKGMMQLKCKRKNSCVVYGEGAMIGCMCQKWFAKFHAGDFLVNDALWSSRPVEVDSDQIETLIENNQCYTMRETANILKISKSIKLLMKMKNVVFYFMEKTHGLFDQLYIFLLLITQKRQTDKHMEK